MATKRTKAPKLHPAPSVQVVFSPQPELRPVDEHEIDCLLARYGAAPWAKVSTCGRRFSLTEWLALPLDGHQKDDVEDLELRTCPSCRSTMAVVLHPDGSRTP